MGMGISRFSAQQTSLFNSVKSLDQADNILDGNANNISIFKDKKLQDSYQKAMADGASPEDTQSFLDQYLENDMNDDGKINASGLNNTITDENKEEIKNISQNFLTESEIISILKENDNGKGNVFENAGLMSKLDLLDDNNTNYSVYNLKSSVVNNPEEPTETESLDELKSKYICYTNDHDSEETTKANSVNDASKNTNALDASVLKNSSPTGAQIAEAAYNRCANYSSDGQHCLGGVAQALLTVKDKDGKPIANLTGYGHAYMAADVLASNDNFQEIKGITRDDIKTLPAGAVIVWSNTNGHKSGHISVALGDGREASDIFRNQMTQYSDSYRIFVPNDMADKIKP